MRTLVALVLAFALAPAASARQAAEEPDPAARERAVAAALAAADAALPVADSLRSLENRLYLQAMALQALSTRDPGRARVALAGVAKSLSTALASVDPYTSDGGQRWQALYSLRNALAHQIAERDPAAAIELVRSTRASLPAGMAEENAQQEAQLELQFAQQLAARDPRSAAEAVERLLAAGRFDYMLLYSIQAIRQHDPEAASRLMTGLVAAVTRADLDADYGAAYLAAQLFQSEVSARVAHSEGPLSGMQPNSMIDDAAFRSLGEALFAAASGDVSELERRGMGVQQALWIALDAAAKNPGALWPGGAEEVRRALADLGDLPIARMSQATRVVTVDHTAPVEELLRAAAGAPEEERDSLYWQAVNRALGEGDDARAVAIVEEHVKNPRRRAELLRQIESQRLYRAMSASRYDEALQHLPEGASPYERAETIAQLAEAALSSGDPKTAARLLAEAESALDAAGDDATAFAARLRVAQAYAGVDAARGFAVVERCADRLNGLLEAAAALDGFGCDDSFDEGELRIQQGGSFAALLIQTTDALMALSAREPLRALETARRLERPEARAYATLRVAAAVLAASAGSEQQPAQGAGTL